MNTPSHLLINAALHKGLRRTAPIPRSAFLLGAIAPDVPLYLLSIGGFVYYRYGQGWEVGRTFEYMFDTLFFTDPYWIALHNMFHSPTVLLILLACCWPLRRKIGSPARWLFWFAAGCLIHTMIDIPTHGNDGPLLLFPFEWTMRYHSPISYWDPRYYGREFVFFELSLNLVLLAYLLVPVVMRRLKRRNSASQASCSGD